MNECSIFLKSGKRFDFNDFGPEDIDLNDIIWNQSNDCRFGGVLSIGTDQYSVLHHALYCDEILYAMHLPWEGIDEDRELTPDEEASFSRKRLLVLTHDFHEAYTKNITGPLINQSATLRSIQGRIDQAIRIKFGLETGLNGVTEEEEIFVHKIDIMARIGEALMWMPSEAADHFVAKHPSEADELIALGCFPGTCSSEQARREMRIRMVNCLGQLK